MLLGTRALPALVVASLLAVALAAPHAARAAELERAPLHRLAAAAYVALLAAYYAGLDDAGRRGGTAAGVAWHVAFYLAESVANVTLLSTCWQRFADAFAPEAATRVVGVVGAGATFGQVLGSLATAGVSRYARDTGPPMWLLLVAAACYEAAGRLAAALVPVQPDRAKAEPAGARPESELGAGGAELIRQSPYLRHIALVFVLHATVSTLFYFQKVAVVARLRTSGGRTGTLAEINTVVGCVTGVLQLTMSGRALRVSGVPHALAALPVAGLVAVAALAVRPVPVVVGFSEVLRKVVGYVLTRPARELLFTVTSRSEKFRAKALLDTFVIRTGDVMAAALFELLHRAIPDAGPGLGAAIAAPACVLWALTAHALGARYVGLLSKSPR